MDGSARSASVRSFHRQQQFTDALHGLALLQYSLVMHRFGDRIKFFTTLRSKLLNVATQLRKLGIGLVTDSPALINRLTDKLCQVCCVRPRNNQLIQRAIVIADFRPGLQLHIALKSLASINQLVTRQSTLFAMSNHHAQVNTARKIGWALIIHCRHYLNSIVATQVRIRTIMHLDTKHSLFANLSGCRLGKPCKHGAIFKEVSRHEALILTARA